MCLAHHLGVALALRSDLGIGLADERVVERDVALDGAYLALGACEELVA